MGIQKFVGSKIVKLVESSILEIDIEQILVYTFMGI